MKLLRRRSPFIKQFSGPGHNGIVCFRFWEAVVASGCPGECAYCFLQTQFPYRRGLYDLKGTLFENLPDIVTQARSWLRQPRAAGLIIGENQDGLAFEEPYRRTIGISPLQLLIPLFAEQNPVGHTLIVLSKFTSTKYAERLGPCSNVVFSWSLSLPTISSLYEKKVPGLEARLQKAASMKKQGYRIRFRLDALAPILGWKEELKEVITRINEIRPEMLTAGALRATNVRALRNAAAANGRDDSIFNYIHSKDPSDFKYRTGIQFQTEAFRLIRKSLHSSIRFGLCKEDQTIWDSIQAPWQGCNCLHSAEDWVALKRMRRLPFWREIAGSNPPSSATG